MGADYIGYTYSILIAVGGIVGYMTKGERLDYVFLFVFARQVKLPERTTKLNFITVPPVYTPLGILNLFQAR